MPWLLKKTPQALADFVAQAPKYGESYGFISFGSRWVIDAPMNALGLPRKDRTALLCLVTDRDHVVEFLSYELIHRLGPVVGDIDTDLAHRFYGKRVDAARLHARAKYLKLVPTLLAKKPLRHLATSRITCTKNEDMFWVSHYYFLALLMRVLLSVRKAPCTRDTHHNQLVVVHGAVTLLSQV